MKKTVMFLVVMFLVMSVPALGETDITVISIGKVTGEQINLLDVSLSKLLKKQNLTKEEIINVAKLSEARRHLVDSYIQILGISLIGKAQQMSMPPSGMRGN